MTIVKCSCGRRMSKNSQRCTKCHNEHMEALYSKARAIVATGTCPDCGADLVHNTASAGWYMCARKGAPGFRKDPTGASCDFQCFTQ